MLKNPSAFSRAGSGTASVRGIPTQNFPVESVTWLECTKFITKLNEKYKDELLSGYSFSLPTEAQWEYACRAGKNLPYSADGWYEGNSKRPAPVGRRRANAWGLYDMHGNVSEWCLDWYGRYSGDSTDPYGPLGGSTRIHRGGSYFHKIQYLRSAVRLSLPPNNISIDYVGLRLALTHKMVVEKAVKNSE